MSGISSGIGLVSGINTANLIDQLIAIEARPIRDLEARVRAIDVQRTAYLELSAKILAVKSATANFDKLALFRRFTGTSTNESVLRADVRENAVAGTHTFRVHSLSTNHAAVSRGFGDADSEPVGTGVLSIEMGHGRVAPSTALASLHGGQGIPRGTIVITDRGGATAQIDLTRAVTLDDVLEAINTNTDVNVRARVTGLTSNGASGDRLVIEDASGGTGNLIIRDTPGGSTAAALGIAAQVAADRVDGVDLIRLTENTPLHVLNDGNGVDRLLHGTDLQFTSEQFDFGVSLSDVLELSAPLAILNSGQGVRLGVIRITDRTGQSATVDLTNAANVGDVIAAINGAGLNVSATVVNSHVQIVDNSENLPAEPPPFKIEDVSGFTAADLGIAGEVVGAAVSGRDVYRVATVGDLLRAVNEAPDNNGFVQISIAPDGNGLRVETFGFPPSEVTVTAGEGSGAAHDLGLEGVTLLSGQPVDLRPLAAGLNTVLLQSLRGGAGVGAGTVRFTDRANQTTTIDFSAARTLQDVIDLINADDATGITASVNATGNGMVLRDESEGVMPHPVIQDVTGSLAEDLGIARSPDDSTVTNEVNGDNLQLQYVSRQTRLSDLNGGRGVSLGSFRLTDTTGAVHVVQLSQNLRTVGQVVDAVNATAPLTLRARINDQGDGILITDTALGAVPLKIEDVDGGRTAADLRLRQTAQPGENFVDGSYEVRVEVGGGDTLEDLVAKLNGAGGDFTAAILNDHAGINPFRLTVNSAASGRRGELLIDDGGLGIGFETLTRARDAVVTIGDGSPAEGLLIAGPSNTLDDVIEGVTLNLLAADENPVTVTVAQDVDGIVEDVRDFVDKYNDVQDAIDEAIAFNPDTRTRGPLLGDFAVTTIRNRLHRVAQQSFTGAGESFDHLTAVGIRLGAGNRLEFDEERFRQRYESSPAQVEQLFTAEETGFGTVLKEVVDDLTRDFDGVLAQKDQLLQDQQELLNDRIGSLNVLLDGKRARLQAQFVGLEQSLALLQGQQNSLVALAQLAATTRQ